MIACKFMQSWMRLRDQLIIRKQIFKSGAFLTFFFPYSLLGLDILFLRRILTRYSSGFIQMIVWIECTTLPILKFFHLILFHFRSSFILLIVVFLDRVSVMLESADKTLSKIHLWWSNVIHNIKNVVGQWTLYFNFIVSILTVISNSST